MAVPEQSIHRLEISDILSMERIQIAVDVSSKKKLMEHIAESLSEGTGVDSQCVFKVIVERERLGSTGIGNGVALPHGRLTDLNEPIIAVSVLSDGLDYQAADDQEVRIVIGLIVPADADQAHLQILSQLAKLLSQNSVCESIINAKSKEVIYSALTAE